MTYNEEQYNDACYTYWTAISKMSGGYIPTTKDDREFKAAIKIKNTYEFEYNDKKVLEQRGHDKAMQDRSIEQHNEYQKRIRDLELLTNGLITSLEVANKKLAKQEESDSG